MPGGPVAAYGPPPVAPRPSAGGYGGAPPAGLSAPRPGGFSQPPSAGFQTAQSGFAPRPGMASPVGVAPPGVHFAFPGSCHQMLEVYAAVHRCLDSSASCRQTMAVSKPAPIVNTSLQVHAVLTSSRSILSEQEHSPLGRLLSPRQDPTVSPRLRHGRAQRSRRPRQGPHSSSLSARRAATARPGPAGTGRRPSARRRPSAARPPAAWAPSSARGHPRRGWAASDRTQQYACCLQSRPG